MFQQPVTAANSGQGSPLLVTVGGQPVQTHTVSMGPNMGNTQVEFENEKGSMKEIIHAPQPSYNDEHDEEYGFIGGA